MCVVKRPYLEKYWGRGSWEKKIPQDKEWKNCNIYGIKKISESSKGHWEKIIWKRIQRVWCHKTQKPMEERGSKKQWSTQ